MDNLIIDQKLDHLIYTAQFLDEGIEKIESLLGVKPIMGGRHPNWGTHNALLSLGNTYLEIVAPDPESDIPAQDTWIGSLLTDSPKLGTWALKTEDIKGLYQKAIAHQIELGAIEFGKRQKPDGSWLHWQLTDPYSMPFGGAIPFLIDWGNTPHPSSMTPIAGHLKELIIVHPTPNELRVQLAILGAEPRIEKGEKFEMKVKIQTPDGLVSIA